MSPIKKKYKKNGRNIKLRTKIIAVIVILFVIVMGLAYWNLQERTAKIQKEQQQVEQKIKDAKNKKTELKKEKKYINTKEFIEKTAREKFGLFYPDEYVVKSKE
ncbi:MAG: septum formation initiator family protein [Anaerostipes sp.]|nr:septum formation initiator family protein [Anaerostipes sp.]MDD3747278.1 septum formation initiator family protein [Anaerostipes sp.]